MGLDPNNVTWDAIFNRQLEIFLHNITLASMFALVGAIFFVATLLTHTMVPLRVAKMIGCAFFAIFGALTGAVRRITASKLYMRRSMPPCRRKSAVPEAIFGLLDSSSGAQPIDWAEV